MAGVSAVTAGIAFLVSGVCIAIFFATESDAWGRANDATIALFAALMIPPVIDIYQRFAAGERWIVALPTVLGFLAWMIWACTLVLRLGGLPRGPSGSV